MKVRHISFCSRCTVVHSLWHLSDSDKTALFLNPVCILAFVGAGRIDGVG